LSGWNFNTRSGNFPENIFKGHLMAKAVVIVESPAKVKTINKFLGPGFKVLSSMGHLVDLPKSTLGVDIENNFEPKFIVVRSKQKQLTKIKKESKGAREIYFATDPDREGEAIGWNLVAHLGEGKEIFRVSFQEITKEAVLEAFKNSRKFDMKRINAQIARRLLDRIVGYKISPLLWKKVGSRLSAGRVQSVALRLIVEREKEIKAFIPREYWQIAVDLTSPGAEGHITAGLEKIDNEKVEIGSESGAQSIVVDLARQDYVVRQVTERTTRRKALAPLITSTLQQEAFNKLKFNSSRTMLVAQQLYEGVDLGGGETTGLITYMRTDSVNVSQDALGKLRGYIEKNYGKEYLPDDPNQYKSRKSSQEAHEAIRPTSVLRTPGSLRDVLEPDQMKLYMIIWNRFVSSQMTPAVYVQKKMEISAGKYQFGASGSILQFDGYLTVEREEKEEDRIVDFSRFREGERLELKEVRPTQHFTKPPARFSDASLVKALEEDGIGRPSTYASIISTLVLRNYVVREKGYLSPTELGTIVSDLLVTHFPRIVDAGFTALMEEQLDLVEEGTVEYHQLLADFYKPFEKELKLAESLIERTDEAVGRPCPKCSSPLIYKWGRRGKFISCSSFPQCDYAEPVTTGVTCPREGCGGFLVLRSSRRGSFYGCTNYPKCDFVSKDLPSESNSDTK
jgi:DNA topoisomerase-1